MAFQYYPSVAALPLTFRKQSWTLLSAGTTRANNNVLTNLWQLILCWQTYQVTGMT